MDVFNFERIFLNELPLTFLFETIFRTSLTFIVVLLSMRLIGRRGVKQLSVMELIVVLILGSAAGDAALNNDTPLLPAYFIFIVIVSLYRLVTYLIDKSDRVEILMEGRSVLIVEKGELAFEDKIKKNFSADEILSSLRQLGISHLGQVHYCYLETDGNFSVFRFSEGEIKPGCPILPFARKRVVRQFIPHDYFSCRFCTHTIQAETEQVSPCDRCGRTEWLTAWTGEWIPDLADIALPGKPQKTGSKKPA